MDSSDDEDVYEDDDCRSSSSRSIKHENCESMDVDNSGEYVEGPIEEGSHTTTLPLHFTANQSTASAALDGHNTALLGKDGTPQQTVFDGHSKPYTPLGPQATQQPFKASAQIAAGQGCFSGEQGLHHNDS